MNKFGDNGGATDMNGAYLGDALDNWKGSLFFLFLEAVVDSMATNGRPWTPDDFKRVGKGLEGRT